MPFLVVAAPAGIGFAASLVVAAANIAQSGPLLDALDITHAIAGLLPFLEAILVAIGVVYILRAASQGLLVLMDIEKNTRSDRASAVPSSKKAA